jgi:hypothetical protein
MGGNSRGIARVATALLFGGVVCGAYVFDRRFRRWVKENHALADVYASANRMRTTYRGKRADVGEAAGLIGYMVHEIAQSIPETHGK